MLPDIFESTDALQAAFVAGLERQLDEEPLGTFILVLANALFDHDLFERLRDRLAERFDERRNRYSEALRHGHTPGDAPDDMLVFLKLIAMGFEHLAVTEYRRAKHWEMQFNQVRSLRPKRMSGSLINHLSIPFDHAAFHFNKPFLDKEVFWTGEFGGFDARLLYNKFPFAPLHGLLVPQPLRCLPQMLNDRRHIYAWELATEIGERIPGIGLAYNAFGAGASINHLHFQLFVREQALPVMDPRWIHNGGEIAYPASCSVFDDRDEAWRYIANLHHANTTYNLLYLPGRMLCLPRRYQGSYPLPAWTENVAWYEMCGGMTTFDRDDFNRLDDPAVQEALRDSRPHGYWK